MSINSRQGNLSTRQIFSIRKLEKLYFVPPESIYEFFLLKTILGKYGVKVRSTIPTKARDYWKLKLYASVPRNLRNLVSGIIRAFGGKIREEEILVTKNFLEAVRSPRGIGNIPIGVSADGKGLTALDLPSRVVVAGDENMGLSLILVLLYQYLSLGNDACLVLGRDVDAHLGAVSRSAPLLDRSFVGDLAYALAFIHNMAQSRAGIERLLLQRLYGESGEGEEVVLGREAELVENFLNAVSFSEHDPNVVTYDFSHLPETYQVVLAYYLLRVSFPFVFGVSDRFLDFARHSSSPYFVFYSPVVDLDRLYRKAQPDYIVLLTREKASLYIFFEVGEEPHYVELGFQPLWRVLE